MNVIENYVLPEGKSLGLKATLPTGVPESPHAPKGFRWNLTPGGETEAPDWNSEPECGGGLHLWAWAQGDPCVSRIWGSSGIIWLAVEYESDKAVDLIGKVKVPRCRTIAVSSNRKEVVSFIQARTPEDLRGPSMDEKVVEVEEGDVEVGDGGVAIVRGRGTAKAGDGGIVYVRGEGEAIVGGHGFVYAGDKGTAKAGPMSTVIVGDGGTAVAGDCSYVRVGVGGKAKVLRQGSIYLVGKHRNALLVTDLFAYSYQNQDPRLRSAQKIKSNTFYTLDESDNPVEVP